MEEPVRKPVSYAVVKYNLLGLLAAAVLAASLSKATDGGAAILFGVAFLAQAGVNLLVGFGGLVTGGPAAPYFLSALLVVLIGFGACTGMLALNLVPLNFH